MEVFNLVVCSFSSVTVARRQCKPSVGNNHFFLLLAELYKPISSIVLDTQTVVTAYIVFSSFAGFDKKIVSVKEEQIETMKFVKKNISQLDIFIYEHRKLTVLQIQQSSYVKLMIK